MVNIIVEHTVNAPVASVWASWDDYANIAEFHPGLNASYLLASSPDTGLGAIRQCDFTDGKTFLKEKVTGYVPNKRIEIDIFGTNAPIKDAKALFEFEAKGTQKTLVRMTMTFTPKMGLLGRLMSPLMKMQFRKGLAGLLKSNAQYVERSAHIKAVA